MSFGRFACIYGIGYVAMDVVAALTMSIYLYRTYHDSWIRVLVRMVRNVLLWPVMIPRNIILVMRECEAEYKKHYL